MSAHELTAMQSVSSSFLPMFHGRLSPNHYKLLYLVSLYAVASNSTKQNERWIRQIPLYVLLYEGIQMGIFLFDYAPASVCLSLRGKTMRRWMNISREGKGAIDDLWEMQLLNGLKLSSDDFQPVTAYQVSFKGLFYLKSNPNLAWQHDVDKLVFPPTMLEHKPTQVFYDGTKFSLKSGGFAVPSSITDCEDVSYVSSPYLPPCLRSFSETFHVQEVDNSDRAEESSLGTSNISKRTTETLRLGFVQALVGEWVPCGSNQIVALNERMGALDRCQGGILTSIVDFSPTDARFNMPVGATLVRILDFDFVRFINFEAESHYPETAGIVQLESFGMHFNCDGSLIYGIRINAIMDRKEDNVSIDHLARVLVDVHQDSSTIVNDLLSPYQVSLLDMLFLGDSMQRNKFNCILARNIHPLLPARKYLETPSYAHELAQVLGDLYAAFDLSPNDLIVLGKAGLLYCGPNAHRIEQIVIMYVTLVCRDMFMTNFFARTFMLDATLKEIRRQIHHVDRQHSMVLRIRDKLAVAARDTILLAETLEYLLDSLEDFSASPPTTDQHDIVFQLFELLAIPQLKAQTLMRCNDSIKLMEGTMLQLEQLQMMAEAMATTQLESACQKLHMNTKELILASDLQETMCVKMHVIQHLCGGLFAFDVLDRLTGGTLNGDMARWAIDAMKPLMQTPMVWWLVNMACLTLFSLLFAGVAEYFHRKGVGMLTIKAELNRKVNVTQLKKLLTQKAIRQVYIRLHGPCESCAVNMVPTVVKSNSKLSSIRFQVLGWHETDRSIWGGALPHIEICFDEKHDFLLYVSIRIDTKDTHFREDDCIRAFEKLIKQVEEKSKDKEDEEVESRHSSFMAATSVANLFGKDIS